MNIPIQQVVKWFGSCIKIIDLIDFGTGLVLNLEKSYFGILKLGSLNMPNYG